MVQYCVLDSKNGVYCDSKPMHHEKEKQLEIQIHPNGVGWIIQKCQSWQSPDDFFCPRFHDELCGMRG